VLELSLEFFYNLMFKDIYTAVVMISIKLDTIIFRASPNITKAKASSTPLLSTKMVGNDMSVGIFIKPHSSFVFA